MAISDIEKLNTLVEEYKVINSRIESFINSQNRFFWQGLAIVFGLFTINRNVKDSSEIILILPLLIIVYFALFLYHYQRCLTNQLYKGHIESRINELSNEKLLFYFELGYERVEKSNWFIYFNLASYTILIVGSIGLMIYTAFMENYFNWFFWLILSLTLIAGIGLILCYRRIPATNKKITDSYIPEILKSE